MCDCESLILMNLIAREERMHGPFISVHSGASEAEVNGGNGVRRHQKRVEDGGIFERRSVANQVFCSKTLERCERLRGEFVQQKMREEFCATEDARACDVRRAELKAVRYY